MRTLEEHRVYMRAWRKTPRAIATTRAYESRPEVRAYRQAFGRTYQEGYKGRHRTRDRAKEKDYKQRYRRKPENQAKEREYRRRWYADHYRPATPPTPLPEFYPFLTGGEQSCDLLLAVHSLVPPLPEELRQEVCQDAIVTVLSGACSLLELPDRMNEIIRIAQRRNNPWTLSLDQPIAGTDLRLRDVI